MEEIEQKTPVKSSPSAQDEKAQAKSTSAKSKTFLRKGEKYCVRKTFCVKKHVAKNVLNFASKNTWEKRFHSYRLWAAKVLRLQRPSSGLCEFREVFPPERQHE